MCVHAKSFSHVWLFVTLWTVDHQAPLSKGFSRQEYWSRLPCPPLGDLPHPGSEPRSLLSPALQAGSLPLVPPGKPRYWDQAAKISHKQHTHAHTHTCTHTHTHTHLVSCFCGQQQNPYLAEQTVSFLFCIFLTLWELILKCCLEKELSFVNPAIFLWDQATPSATSATANPLALSWACWTKSSVIMRAGNSEGEQGGEWTKKKKSSPWEEGFRRPCLV